MTFILEWEKSLYLKMNFFNKYLKENILEEGSYINVADDSLIAFLDNKYQAVKIYC